MITGDYESLCLHWGLQFGPYLLRLPWSLPHNWNYCKRPWTMVLNILCRLAAWIKILSFKCMLDREDEQLSLRHSGCLGRHEDGTLDVHNTREVSGRQRAFWSPLHVRSGWSYSVDEVSEQLRQSPVELNRQTTNLKRHFMSLQHCGKSAAELCPQNIKIY